MQKAEAQQQPAPAEELPQLPTDEAPNELTPMVC